MAEHDHTTTPISGRRAAILAAVPQDRRRQRPAAPTPAADYYVRAPALIRITFHQPGPTARSKPSIVTGHLLGTLHARGRVHHYRVEGSAGVVYFVPPAWLDAASQAAVAAPTINPGTSKSEIIRSLIREISALLDARDARNGVPE